MNTPLHRLEEITGSSRAASRIEALLPAGVRHRQLRVRTLFPGMMVVLADRRPACLTEAHTALTSLPADDQRRLGVTEGWKTGPHHLTYRQAGRTFGLVTKALGKDQPGGTPSDVLARTCDDLLEASILPQHKDTSAALAVDWTDAETFSRPPRHGTTGAPTPKPPGDTATATCPARKASCSSATTSPPPP